MRGIATVFSIVCVLLIALVPVFWWWMVSSTRYEADRAALEWRAAKAAESTLGRGAVPEGWDAGIFLSNDTLVAALANFEGTAMSLPDEDVTATLETFRLASRPGFVELDFLVTAVSVTKNVSVALNVKSELLFDGDGSATDVLRFKVVPLAIEPSLTWYSFDINGSNFASELIKAGVLGDVLDDLVFEIPADLAFDFSLGQTLTSVVDTNKNLNSTATLEVRIPEFTAGWAGRTLEALPAATGIWILAADGDPGPAPTLVVPAGSSARDETEAIRRLIEETVSVPDYPAGIWLAARPLLSALGALARTDAGTRTVTIHSTQVQGRLANKDWSDDTLGGGGVYAEFPSADAVSGAVLVDGLASSWSPGSGIDIRFRALAQANAKVALHFDPLVGGGVGTTIGLVGATSADVAANLDLKVVAVDGGTVMFVSSTANCPPVEISLTTDGNLGGDLGWIKVPAVGITRKQALDLGLGPESVLDSSPFFLQLEPQTIQVGDGQATVVPPFHALGASITPAGVEHRQEGWLAGLDFAIEGLDAVPDQGTLDAKRADLEAAAKARMQMTECPIEESTAVLIGDIEIGPNNEIVKFLVSIGKFSQEMADRIGQEVSDEKLNEWIKDPAGSFERSDPGRIAQETLPQVTVKGNEVIVTLPGGIKFDANPF